MSPGWWGGWLVKWRHIITYHYVLCSLANMRTTLYHSFRMSYSLLFQFTWITAVVCALGCLTKIIIFPFSRRAHTRTFPFSLCTFSLFFSSPALPFWCVRAANMAAMKYTCNFTTSRQIHAKFCTAKNIYFLPLHFHWRRMLQFPFNCHRSESTQWEIFPLWGNRATKPMVKTAKYSRLLA